MHMIAAFTGIQVTLMVGIGGGISSAEVDIWPGDVVVSHPGRDFGGVVRYNVRKATIDKFAPTGLNSPPLQILLTVVANRNNAGPDVLFEATYDHQGGHTCDECSTERQEARPLRDRNIRDGCTRDKLCSELGGILCIQMEALGMMDSFPYLVIRGISDYADSHKNKMWHPYAAGIAAVYAKEVLSMIKPSELAQTRTVGS
ncbi:hypothetical protein GQ44DRAFT_743705 [Phaeosphaeriaceae sp. PMI808]|nr:hypothetical protein GQ44DRAFT_743705 [Phaeosphaeriaceae sp. PMI808]